MVYEPVPENTPLEGTLRVGETDISKLLTADISVSWQAAPLQNYTVPANPDTPDSWEMINWKNTVEY